MNKVPLVIIAIGIFVIILGIIVIGTGLRNAGETAEEGILYEDINGTIELKGESDADPHLYVHIKSKYVGGMTGGHNERHGNDTWNLTADDCDLVTNFTLTNASYGNQIFIPRCDYVQDIVGDDEWIVVGTLCKQYTNYEDEKRNTIGSGCKDGIYTWDSKGKEVLVYDGDMLGQAFAEGLISLLSSFGACCCGVIILLIGILMAFTMEDNDTAQYGAENTEHALLNNNQDNSFEPHRKSGWDGQEDYIYKEKKEEETEEVKEKDSKPEEKTAEKKRSGEYKAPPPPEY